uniref:Death domain-associated protein 6 n=1 Tax=Steinernema glaseri TaxID=37863 RepID=A0A1I8AG46_9BILA
MDSKPSLRQSANAFLADRFTDEFNELKADEFNYSFDCSVDGLDRYLYALKSKVHLLFTTESFLEVSGLSKKQWFKCFLENCKNVKADAILEMAKQHDNDELRIDICGYTLLNKQLREKKEALTVRKDELKTCCKNLQRFYKLVMDSKQCTEERDICEVDQKVLELFKKCVLALLDDAYCDDTYFNGKSLEFRLKQKLQAFCGYEDSEDEMNSTDTEPSDEAMIMMYQLFIDKCTKNFTIKQRTQILNDLIEEFNKLKEEHESLLKDDELKDKTAAARMKVNWLSTKCQQQLYEASYTAVYDMLLKCRKQDIFSVGLKKMRDYVEEQYPKLSKSESPDSQLMYNDDFTQKHRSSEEQKISNLAKDVWERNTRQHHISTSEPFEEMPSTERLSYADCAKPKRALKRALKRTAKEKTLLNRDTGNHKKIRLEG